MCPSRLSPVTTNYQIRTMIAIEPISSNTFRVTIDKGVTTTHDVHISEESVFKLTDGRVEAFELLEAAIEFLLEHESNVSIQRN